MTESTSQSADGSGIAQADNGGTATVNYNTYNFPLTSPRPTRAVHLDAPPALFIGREPELAALHLHLAREGSVVYIPGFPGRGKSTLANFYAHQHKDEYQTVHWLPCHAKSLVEIAAEFAWQLDLKLDGDLEANLKQLRAHCARNRCLLILDNVDDEAPAGMLLGGRSSVLLTTWHTNLKFLRPVPAVPLPVFTEDQCFELFRTRIGANEVDRHLAESRLLFERLEHHPFALDIAASLIREDRRYTIAGMAQNLPADIPALFAEAIATLSPEAQSLLAAMAACAPEGFRLSLAAEVAAFDEDAAFQALNQICSRSLAEELDRDTHRYRLHALVRYAARSTDEHRVRHAQAVLAQFRKWEVNWRRCEEDLADWRTALAWTLVQQQHDTWSLAKHIAFPGFMLIKRLGRLSEAYEMWDEIGLQATKHNDPWCLSANYDNKAVILKQWGRLEEAMELHKKQEAICIESGNKASLALSYGNQAVILADWARLDEAMVLHKKEEAIYTELGNKSGLLLSYCNQAGVLQAWRQLTDAMDLHKKEEALCIELDDKEALQRSYGNQTIVLRLWQRLDDAIALHMKAESICIELGAPRELAYCYWQWSSTAKALGDSVGYQQKLDQAFAIFTDLGMSREIASVQAELNE